MEAISPVMFTYYTPKARKSQTISAGAAGIKNKLNEIAAYYEEASKNGAPIRTQFTTDSGKKMQLMMFGLRKSRYGPDSSAVIRHNPYTSPEMCHMNPLIIAAPVGVTGESVYKYMISQYSGISVQSSVSFREFTPILAGKIEEEEESLSTELIASAKYVAPYIHGRMVYYHPLPGTSKWEFSSNNVPVLGTNTVSEYNTNDFFLRAIGVVQVATVIRNIASMIAAKLNLDAFAGRIENILMQNGCFSPDWQVDIKSTFIKLYKIASNASINLAKTWAEEIESESYHLVPDTPDTTETWFILVGERFLEKLRALAKNTLVAYQFKLTSVNTFPAILSEYRYAVLIGSWTQENELVPTILPKECDGLCSSLLAPVQLSETGTPIINPNADSFIVDSQKNTHVVFTPATRAILSVVEKNSNPHIAIAYSMFMSSMQDVAAVYPIYCTPQDCASINNALEMYAIGISNLFRPEHLTKSYTTLKGMSVLLMENPDLSKRYIELIKVLHDYRPATVAFKDKDTSCLNSPRIDMSTPSTPRANSPSPESQIPDEIIESMTEVVGLLAHTHINFFTAVRKIGCAITENDEREMIRNEEEGYIMYEQCIASDMKDEEHANRADEFAGESQEMSDAMDEWLCAQEKSTEEFYDHMTLFAAGNTIGTRKSPLIYYVPVMPVIDRTLDLSDEEMEAYRRLYPESASLVQDYIPVQMVTGADGLLYPYGAYNHQVMESTQKMFHYW